MSIIQSKIIKFNRKWSNLIEKVKNDGQNRQILIKFDNFRYKFEFKIEIRHGFRIEIVAMIDRTGKFGSKMLKKRQFEYDLDRI